MAKQFDIVTIGDCLIDHYIEPEDFRIVKTGAGKKLVLNFARKIPAKRFIMFPGGNALNAAVGMRRLGLKTGIMTDLGEQEEAELIFKRIWTEGVDTALVQRRKGTETDKSVVLVTNGERTAITYHCKKKYKFNSDFQSKWIYLTSLGKGFEKMYSGVEKYKKRNRAKVAFNPGSRQLKNSIGAVRKMIRKTDMLFVNVGEAQKITGKKTNDIEVLMRHLHGMGARVVAITNGQKGAYCYDGKYTYRIACFPAKRVDATGAGDAFASSFTTAVIVGENISEAMRWGSINAAHEISEIGVQNGLLSKGKMQKALSKHMSFKARKF